MDIFSLFLNMLPLAFLVFLGHVAAQWGGVEARSPAKILLFFIVPVVVFGFIAQSSLTPALGLLGIVVFVLHCAISISFLYIGRSIYGKEDKRANLLAILSGNPNSGYMGLPIVIALFAPQWVAAYAVILISSIIYEVTVSYYIAARGHFSVRESVEKLVRFPVLYAAIAGLIVNVSGFVLPEIALTYWGHCKGMYIILGMMLVGINLPSFRDSAIEFSFLALVFVGKFVAWPCLALTLAILDKIGPGFLPPEAWGLILTLSVLPSAANTATYATVLNLRPHDAASAVLYTTVFALFYIPFALWVLGVSFP